MPVTSTRQPVSNEGASRGLICLIAFGPSVIKVAHPWYTTICETSTLRPGSNEVIHVKLRKRKSARFKLFSSFMFLCD